MAEQWQWRGRTPYGPWGDWMDTVEGFDCVVAPYAAIQHRVKPKECGAVAPVTINVSNELRCDREHIPGIEPHHRTLVGGKYIYWED